MYHVHTTGFQDMIYLTAFVELSYHFITHNSADLLINILWIYIIQSTMHKWSFLIYHTVISTLSLSWKWTSPTTFTWSGHWPWWRRQMETFSALLAICARNSPVHGEVPEQRPVTRSFDVFFDLRLNKRLSKQPLGWWFETISRPLWRHRNANCIPHPH